MADIPLGELHLECQNCGSTDLRLPDDATEDSLIICNSCGKTLGTVAEANKEAIRVGRAAMPYISKEIGRAVSKSFKGKKPR